MKEDTKEFLGIGKHDFWYYPGLVAGIASFFASSPRAVVTLLAVSTLFLVIFLVKSTPRYLKSPDLQRGTRIYGLVGNVMLVLLQVGIVGYRLSIL
jgi:hypothetical protein